MPDLQQISEPLIRDHITRAVADVFSTMLSRQVKLEVQPELAPAWPPIPTNCSDATAQVVGTVGFIGDINGLIYLYLPAEFARLCTCHLLGMTDAEVEEAGEEVINDAIGELTNMSVGSFKNGLCDAGFPCRLTIPSILRGSNFCVEPISSAERFIYRFSCGQHRVVADILLKGGE